MNLTTVLRSPSSGRLKFLRVVWPVWVTVLSLSRLASAADAPRATNEFVVPKSVFVSNDSRGKDPFFPNRSRLAQPTTVTSSVTNTAPNLNDLQLKGITGTAERRTALINNLTFGKGEEGEVRARNGKIKIRVLEIRDKSVLLQIEGLAEPKVLLLPDRLLPVGE